jgi:hypothetical protein
MRVPWWLWVLAGVVLVGGLLAPLASSRPDGLASVIQQQRIPMAETKHPALLPDYRTPGLAGERASLFVAAGVGILAVFAVTWIIGRLLSHRAPALKPSTTGGPPDHEPSV